MGPNPADQRLALAIAGSGLLYGIGWLVAARGGPAILLAVAITAAGGALFNIQDPRLLRILVWWSLLLSGAAAGFGLGGEAELSSGSLVMAAGALLAAASAIVFATSLAHVEDAGGPIDAALLVGGSLVAAIGSLLDWIDRDDGLIVGGRDFPSSRYALGLGIVAVVLGGIALASRSRRSGSSLWAIATVIAVAIPALVGELTLNIHEIAGVGLLLVIVGGVVAAAAAAAVTARSLGFPEPSVPTWVGAAAIGLGVIGGFLGTVAAESVEDAGGSVFLARVMGTALFITGAGLLTRQMWAWLLGFLVASFGLYNGIAGLLEGGGLFGDDARNFSSLTILIYGNALVVLWRSKGFQWSEEPPPSVPPPRPPAAAPSIVPPAPGSVPASPQPAAAKAPPRPTVTAPVGQTSTQPAETWGVAQFSPTRHQQTATTAPGRGLPPLAQKGLIALALVVVAFGAYALVRSFGDDTPTTAAEAEVPGALDFGPVEDAVVPINATSESEPFGSCSANLTFTWFFDLAEAPPADAPLNVHVKGPGMDNSFIPDYENGVVTAEIAVSLAVGGTWEAQLTNFGEPPIVDPPLPVTVGRC